MVTSSWLPSPTLSVTCADSSAVAAFGAAAQQRQKAAGAAVLPLGSGGCDLNGTACNLTLTASGPAAALAGNYLLTGCLYQRPYYLRAGNSSPSAIYLDAMRTGLWVVAPPPGSAAGTGGSSARAVMLSESLFKAGSLAQIEADSPIAFPMRPEILQVPFETKMVRSYPSFHHSICHPSTC